jgi:hypothetical protein
MNQHNKGRIEKTTLTNLLKHKDYHTFIVDAYNSLLNRLPDTNGYLYYFPDGNFDVRAKQRILFSIIFSHECSTQIHLSKWQSLMLKLRKFF